MGTGHPTGATLTMRFFDEWLYSGKRSGADVSVQAPLDEHCTRSLVGLPKESNGLNATAVAHKLKAPLDAQAVLARARDLAEDSKTALFDELVHVAQAQARDD